MGGLYIKEENRESVSDSKGQNGRSIAWNCIVPMAKIKIHSIFIEIIAKYSSKTISKIIYLKPRRVHIHGRKFLDQTRNQYQMLNCEARPFKNDFCSDEKKQWDQRSQPTKIVFASIFQLLFELFKILKSNKNGIRTEQFDSWSLCSPSSKSTRSNAGSNTGEKYRQIKYDKVTKEVPCHRSDQLKKTFRIISEDRPLADKRSKMSDYFSNSVGQRAGHKIFLTNEIRPGKVHHVGSLKVTLYHLSLWDQPEIPVDLNIDKVHGNYRKYMVKIVVRVAGSALNSL